MCPTCHMLVPGPPTLLVPYTGVNIRPLVAPPLQTERLQL